MPRTPPNPHAFTTPRIGGVEPQPALTQDSVRDLAWVLTSPAMFWLGHPAPELTTELGALRRWLKQLDQSPKPLNKALTRQRSHRLGIYFETLIKFYIIQQLRPALLYDALPVRDKHRTHGEYDFLVRRRSNSALLHLEVSLKFYLGIVRHDGSSLWVGLNRDDRLIDKHHKMRDQQIQLSTRPLARTQLQRLGSQVGKRCGLIKGRLFYPLDTQMRTQVQAPTQVSVQHLRGWWARFSQLEQLIGRDGSTRLVWLQRRQWLAVLSAEQAQRLITDQTGDEGYGDPLRCCPLQPAMYARLRLTPQGWREQDRGVLVPDPWLAPLLEPPAA